VEQQHGPHNRSTSNQSAGTRLQTAATPYLSAEEDMVLTWRSRGDYGRREVQIEELDVDSVEE